MHLAANLRHLRKLKGLTQQEMAFECEIPKNSIGSYEEGRCEPNIKTLIKLSDYFQISIDTLLKTDLQSLILIQ